jgi:tellurium resistance protein TerD
MIIDLTKGQAIDLTKAAPGVSKFYVGLGWPASGDDLDVSVFPCEYNASGDPQLISPPYFIYYNQLTSPCGGIIHSPDERQGAQDGDDEYVIIDTNLIDKRIVEIANIVTIHGAPASGRTFGHLKGESYIRICELIGTDQPGREIARYRLEESAKDFCAVQFGSLIKRDGHWDFEAVGNGYSADLGMIVQQYMPGAQIKQ